MCFYLRVCVCVMCPICILITTEAKEGTLEPLELLLQVVVSCPTQVLE